MLESYFSLIRMGLSVGGVLIFLLFELAVPYRPSTVSKAKRWAINIGMSLMNSILLTLIFRGAIVSAAAYAQSQNAGVLNMVGFPQWFRVLATLVFMDFMLYIWHLLNHETPLLWRFHRVHHADLNMDVSSATRFHIGELMISAVIKIGLVYFIGADLLGVIIFESALVLSAQFHHSSLRVPAWFEKYFWLLFVPPSMHRIHHSVVIKERDTNYGTVFSIWDRIFGTMRSDVAQDRIKIGVGAYQNEKKLNLHHLLAMPFTPSVK
jgi:sterol desaturase/sphingolipid hydroxylase (fatty acid hydroxylase superfamily)